MKILIPLDGSKLGEAGLHYVEDLIFNLSAEQKVEVTLIQVLAPATRHFTGGNSISEIPLTEKEMEPIKKKALDYLNQAGESLRSKGATVNCKVQVGKIGVTSAEEIIKLEAETNADHRLPVVCPARQQKPFAT
jgi:hypothetical protein